LCSELTMTGKQAEEKASSHDWEAAEMQTTD
jgi:hypothetical protein